MNNTLLTMGSVCAARIRHYRIRTARGGRRCCCDQRPHILAWSYRFPRGCSGFDGGSEMTWCMPRGQLSSLIQQQTHSCQRRQLRSRRL